jgi:phage shock protein C
VAEEGGPPPNQPRRLTRSRDRKLGGVCGGVAEYFEVDPTIVRVVFVVLLLFPFLPLFGGVLLYFVLWIIMPEPSGEAPPASTPLASGQPRGSGIDGAMLLGGLLVVVGFLFLFQRTVAWWWPGWWMHSFGAIAWPALLIVVGGLILLAALGRRS